MKRGEEISIEIRECRCFLIARKERKEGKKERRQKGGRKSVDRISISPSFYFYHMYAQLTKIACDLICKSIEWNTLRNFFYEFGFEVVLFLSLFFEEEEEQTFELLEPSRSKLIG